MKINFLSMNIKLLIVTVTKLSVFAHTGDIIRLAALGLSILLGFPAYAGDQYLLVTNREGRDILRYNVETGAFVDVLVPAGSGGMNVSYGMAIGPDGNLYVTSLGTEIFPVGHRGVLKFDSQTGEFLGKFAETNGMNDPTDLAFGPDGNLYVSDLTDNKVFQFDGKTGASMGIFATGEVGDNFRGLAWGPDGNLYTGTLGGYVDRFDGITGASLGVLNTSGTGSSNNVAFGPDGLLYVGDYFDSDVNAYDIATGNLVKSFDGMAGAHGLAFNDDGNLLVSSYFTNQIFKFEDGSGLPGTVFADGSPLNGPLDLVLTPVPEPSSYVMLLAGLELLIYRNKMGV